MHMYQVPIPKYVKIFTHTISYSLTVRRAYAAKLRKGVQKICRTFTSHMPRTEEESQQILWEDGQTISRYSLNTSKIPGSRIFKRRRLTRRPWQLEIAVSSKEEEECKKP